MKSQNPFPQIQGAVQAPLVLLLWSALVMFFGHQYQAFALLPSANGSSQILDQDLAGVSHQQINRLLDEMVKQPPPAVPELLDPKDFALDLADALANTDLSRGEWVTSEKTDPKPTVQTLTEPKRKPSQKAAAPATPVIPAVVVQIPKSTTPASNPRPKFVRLPAHTKLAPAMRVDSLRPLKNKARAAIAKGDAGQAYALLRGRVSEGRADIEFLGLLALSSLPHQPAEARVLYEHLAQLQPDEQRWQQALSLLNDHNVDDAPKVVVAPSDPAPPSNQRAT